MVVSSGGMSGEWYRVLSPREREVALLVARGLVNKEIARELNLRVGTIKQHVHSIFLKLRARDFLEPRGRGRYVLIQLMVKESQAACCQLRNASFALGSKRFPFNDRPRTSRRLLARSAED
jgi:DNA-binding NarL/FixJ family response regulator